MFGEHAKTVNVSSTKSATGHMLGAAGAVEARHQRTGRSRRDDSADDQLRDIPIRSCDLNYTPNKAVEREVNAALSNSFGFGGHNTTLAIRRFEELI